MCLRGFLFGGRLMVPLMVAWHVLVIPAYGEVIVNSPEAAPAVLESTTLDLLGLNVAHGRGTALNQLLVTRAQHQENLIDIVGLMEATGAHVVALQEADSSSLWSGLFDHVGYLSLAAEYPSFVHGHHADSWLYTYGTALLSRTRLTEGRSHRFQSTWPTARKGFVRGTLRWRPTPGHAEVRELTLVSVHLDFSRKNVRREQIAELIEDLKGVTTPLIVMGDFNADWLEEDSPVQMLAQGLGLHAYRPAEPMLGTYKGSERLDWILISDDLEFLDFAVRKDIVSDHLAVTARVIWRKEE